MRGFVVVAAAAAAAAAAADDDDDGGLLDSFPILLSSFLIITIQQNHTYVQEDLNIHFVKQNFTTSGQG